MVIVETESTKSDSWISTKKPTSTGNAGLAFDEMSDVNVDKDQTNVSVDNSDREEKGTMSNTNENSKVSKNLFV